MTNADYTPEDIDRAARLAAQATAKHGLAFTHAFQVRLVKRHLASPGWYRADIEEALRRAKGDSK